MYYVRGNPRDYDRWQALGNPGWSYQNVLPYFKKSEHSSRGANAYHSVDGELSVTDVVAPTAISQRFVEAAISLGYDYNPDFNAMQQEGTGSYQFTIKDGKRHSAAAAFLVPVLQRPNLTVTTGALVTRLLFEDTRAVGVEYWCEGTMHQARVDREVILSAGAFDSPKLLMHSGIGDAEQLQALGIDVIVHLPGVGQNLLDHVLVTVTYEATQNLHPVSTNSVGEAGLFLHSEGSVNDAPDLQFFFCPIALPLPGYTQSEQTFTGVICLTHPQNIGRVSLRSAHPEDAPIIQMNYLERGSDARKLVAGIKVVRRLFHSSALDEFRGEEISPGVEIQTDEALIAYIRNTANTVWHPVGTCKMGIDPMAVVDPELRVHGVEGLRVVDASIMPTITTGNTNAPTIMIGEKAADLIKAAAHQQVASILSV